MTDDRGPEDSLNQWKEEMQAGHAGAIANPDSDEEPRGLGIDPDDDATGEKTPPDVLD